jgi:predicted DCC family thiol-disulfide oxidoreductase YuxK
LWADRGRALSFAPLAGSTARSLGEQAPAQDAPPRTLVARVDGLRLERSDAVLAAFARLPWPWKAAAALRALPRPWRDAAYGLVARHRRRLFGGPEACRLPRGGAGTGLPPRLLP